MYYMWTTDNIPELYAHQKPNRWYRIKSKDFFASATLTDCCRYNKIVIKDESRSPKQQAQRKLWEYDGRIKALKVQAGQLLKELEYNFPSPYYSSLQYKQLPLEAKLKAHENHLKLVKERAKSN